MLIFKFFAVYTAIIGQNTALGVQNKSILLCFFFAGTSFFPFYRNYRGAGSNF